MTDGQAAILLDRYMMLVLKLVSLLPRLQYAASNSTSSVEIVLSAMLRSAENPVDAALLHAVCSVASKKICKRPKTHKIGKNLSEWPRRVGRIFFKMESPH